MTTDAKPWEPFETPTAPDELRRHVAELSRAIALHAHNLAALIVEASRLSAMATQLEHTLTIPETPDPDEDFTIEPLEPMQEEP